MLSKIQSKQTIEGSGPEYFIKGTKKIINRNDKYEIEISEKTLGLQLVKRADAMTLKLEGPWDEDNSEAVIKVMNLVKKARRMDMSCGT